MSIDLRSNEFLLKHAPLSLHACFMPVGSTNVEHLTYEKLAAIVRKAWNISLDQVDVYHHSPMCQSLSGATCDRTNHFVPDKITPITTLAWYHLRCLQSVFGIFRTLHKQHFSGIIHVENPQGGFTHLPDVQSMATLTGWCIIQHANHCANTCHLDEHESLPS